MAHLLEHLENGEYEKVYQFCVEQLATNPKDNNLVIMKGWCLFHLKQPEAAAKCIEQGILATDLHIISIKIAQDFFFLIEDHEQLIATSRRHLKAHPNDPDLWYRMALSLAILGQEQEAINGFRHLLDIVPDHVKAKTNLGCLLLNNNAYKEGFELYEARQQAYPHCNWFNGNNGRIPLWQGEDITGKSLLLWSEQGLGDTLQFVRFISVLASRGVEVSLLLKEKHNGLQGLLATVEGLHNVYVVNEQRANLPEDMDYHCSLCSVLHRLNINPSNIVASTPYLIALTAHHSRWDFLKNTPPSTIKIGLVWSTQTPVDGHQLKQELSQANHAKNISLSELAPILALSSCQFFTVQYSVSDTDAVLLEEYGVTNLSQTIKNFNDTAAIIEHMDMMISIDTSVVHLAGAMNKPTINLLPYVNDWRWQENTDTSIWYPSMKLLRQQQRGQWGPVVEQIKNIVETKVLDKH